MLGQTSEKCLNKSEKDGQKDQRTKKFKDPTNAQGEEEGRKEIISYKVVIIGEKIDENAMNIENEPILSFFYRTK